MPGPAPKDPAVRQRRNKPATKVELPAEGARSGVKVPELGTSREWHAETVAWWRDLWESPMAAAFLKYDAHDLRALAALYDDFFSAENSAERLRIAAEIRQQRASYGLSPNDRRRLDWRITEDKPVSHGPEPVRRAPKKGPDPRSLFRVVS
jgi:hypothetical protein